MSTVFGLSSVETTTKRLYIAIGITSFILFLKHSFSQCSIGKKAMPKKIISKKIKKGDRLGDILVGTKVISVEKQ